MLLTWLMLVVYLHLSGPMRRRWFDLAAFGLATTAMLFTFIGIKILKWGTHRYWTPRDRSGITFSSAPKHPTHSMLCKCLFYRVLHLCDLGGIRA